MRKLSIQGASWDSMFLTLVKIVTTLSTIVQTKLLATGLSLEEYGTYSQANIVVSVGTSLILLGLGDAINYFYNSSENSHNISDRIKKVNTIFFLEIIAGILFAVVIILFRNGIAKYFSNNALKVLIPIVASKPVLDNLLYFYQLLYVSVGKAKVIAARNLIITLLRIALIYVAVYVLTCIIWIFCALILLDVLQIMFFKMHFSREGFVVRPYKLSGKSIRPILTYSMPLGIYSITNMLSREVDKLIVGRMTDIETLAIYANCSKILPFDIVVVSFTTVLIPYIMRYISGNENDKAATLFSNYIKIGYYSVWILSAAVLITSEQVISMLYAEEYISGNMVFVIYILDSMLKFASMHLILTAGGKSKLIMLYSFATMILNLLLNIVLYFALGIAGPALATLFTTAIYTYLILRSSVKLIGVKWTDVFDVKDMFSFAAMLVITGAVFFGINHFLLDSDINKYVAMLVSAGGFCVVNLFVNLKRIGSSLKAVNQLRM